MTEITTLIDDYAAGAQLLRDALQTASRVDIDDRPVEGQWSIREVVCHLADAEIVYADRMKRVIAEDNPTFFDLDPNIHVPALAGQHRMLDVEVNLIDAVRPHLLPILMACSDADFSRTGTHSLDGPMTLQILLQRITNHIPHHVAF
ncbi:MAG: DinB family protein, partial [Planctomycetaceae bacterium]|nr:DinB family protein [Planctomycetaceae bacterium]